MKIQLAASPLASDFPNMLDYLQPLCGNLSKAKRFYRSNTQQCLHRLGLIVATKVSLSVGGNSPKALIEPCSYLLNVWSATPKLGHRGGGFLYQNGPTEVWDRWR